MTTRRAQNKGSGANGVESEQRRANKACSFSAESEQMKVNKRVKVNK